MSLLQDARPEFRVSPFGVAFTVYGNPQPGGSKRGFIAKGKEGAKDRVIITDDNPKAEDWKTNCAIVAAELMKGRELFAQPLMIVVEFYFIRPRSHYGARGVLRSSPKFPTVRPDATKLLRPLEDALTGIVWRDDAQIVEQIVRKRYGEPARAEVKVSVVL